MYIGKMYENHIARNYLLLVIYILLIFLQSFIISEYSPSAQIKYYRNKGSPNKGR